MILTVTPNPSLDLLFRSERLVWDDANRLPMPRRRAGGQGINVVRAARALDRGVRARAIAPLGGPVGRELETMLETEGTPLTAVPIHGETRVFVGVRETTTGRSLLLNPRGPAAGPTDEQRLLEALEREIDAADRMDGGSDRGNRGWVACCGSLLPGFADDLYARVGRLARRCGFRFVPDCDGPALASAVEAGCDLLVPNTHEAARLLGRPVAGVEDAARAARELRRLGPDLVALTLGADGAVATDGVGTWHASIRAPEDLAEELDGGSAVGAGDAFLAGLLLAWDRGRTLPDVLEAAVVAGTAALLGRGTDLLCSEDVARVGPIVSRRWMGPK